MNVLSLRQRSAKCSLVQVLHSIDFDRSNTVSFEEFELVVAVSECIGLINQDPVLAFKCIACRMELLLSSSMCKVACLPTGPQEHDSEERRRLLDSFERWILPRVQLAFTGDCFHRHKTLLDKASAKLASCEAKINASMRLSFMSLATLDCLVVVVLILNCWLLSLNGTIEDDSWVRHSRLVLQLFYTIEMGGRLKASLSFNRFYNDPRGAEYSFRNLTELVLWFVGAVAMSFEYIVDSDQLYLCQVSNSLRTLFWRWIGWIR